MSEDNAEWNDTNRAFLQAFMARSTLTLEQAKPLIATILTAYGMPFAFDSHLEILLVEAELTDD